MGIFDGVKRKMGKQELAVINERADPRAKLTKYALIELLDARERELRVARLQLARVSAERVMLQELARQLQNMSQNQMVMLGDVINNAAGMLTDESIAESVRLLAGTVKQIQQPQVEDVVQRLALLDPRTQGVIAAPERQLADRARVVNLDAEDRVERGGGF